MGVMVTMMVVEVEMAVYGRNRHRAVGGPGGHDDDGDCCGGGGVGSIEKEPKVKL